MMSRTPLRITFVGGGTDMPAYYKKYGPGASISCTINKYVYVSVHKRFDDKIRVSYSKTELVDSPDEIENRPVREALKYLGIKKGIEIYHMADVPSGGTGLGSSSSFIVGLLNVLHAWKGENATPRQLAEEAVEIEREMLNEPGGKQDQYAAAFGGFNLFEFKKNDDVSISKIRLSKESWKLLQKHLLLLYTGTEKSNSGVHRKMEKTVEENVGTYKSMVELCYKMFDDLSKNNIMSTGEYMHRNWQLKKTTHGLKIRMIDEYYRKGILAGAEGGKMIGAGNRGFLLFFSKPSSHKKIKAALKFLRPEPLILTDEGSKIIYKED